MKPRNPRKHVRCQQFLPLTSRTFCLSIVSFSLSLQANAQSTIQWTGSSTGAWLTTTNWDPTGTFPGSAPLADPAGEGSAADIFSIIPANAATNIGINMNTLSAAGDVGLILGGMNVNKTNAAGVQIGNSSTTVNGILRLNGAEIEGVPSTMIRVAGNANLTIANVNTGTGTQTMGLRLGATNGIFEVATGRTLTISSNISEESGNASSITKTGNGLVVLSGNNAFTGGSVVNGGGMVFLNKASMPATGSHVFNANTSIGLGVGAAGFFDSADVESAFVGGVMSPGLSNVTVSSTTSVILDTSSGNFTYAGAATDGGGAKSLTKTGANTLTLTGTDNSYSGVTTISAGSLSISTLADAGLNSSIGAFPTAGATGLVLGDVATGGTLVYTGVTTTTNRGFTANGTANTNIINITGAGVKLTMGDIAMQNSASAGFTVNGGAGSSLEVGTYNFNNGNKLVAANIPLTIGTVNYLSSHGLQSNGTSPITIGNINYSAAAANGFFLGGTTTAGGRITGVVASTQGASIGAAAGSAWSFEGTSFTLGNTLRIVSTGTFRIGGSSVLGGTSNTLSQNISYVQAGTINYNSSANQTFAGVISGTNTGNTLTMSGSGTLSLTAVNTFAGRVNVNAGTLRLGNASNTLANTMPINIGGGNLDVDNPDTVGIVTLTSGSISGDSTLTATNYSVQSGNIATTLAGTGGLTKTTAGEVSIAAPLSYTGDTTISSGSLKLATANALPSTSNCVIGAGELNAQNFATASGTLDMADAGSIKLASGGAVAFADSSAVDWSNGSLTISGAFVSGSSLRFGTTNAGLTSTQLGQISASGFTNFALDSNGFLTATSTGSPFLTWSGGLAFDADTNGDGISNGMAWLLGAASPTDNASALLPVVSHSSGNFILYFRALNAASRGAAVVSIQHSNDLGIADPWFTVIVPENTTNVSGISFVVTPSGNMNQVTATIPASESSAGKLFGRVIGQSAP